MSEPGALHGVRVVDVGSAVAGPMAASLLGDQGADVIHVESVTNKDVMRRTGPIDGDISGSWVQLHRNKRFVSIDLRTPEGLDLVLRLAATADVFSQNMRPGVAERRGFGYEQLSARDPELIYLSVSGFGVDGPYSDQPVYDPIIQAVSGFATIQNGTFMKTVVVDKVTAMTASHAVLAALYARSQGRGGQHVEVNLLDSAVSFLWLDAYWNESLPSAEPVPTYSDFYFPYDTADGQIACSFASDAQFEGMCRALGRDDMLTDERYGSRYGRVKYAPEMRNDIATTLKTMTSVDALAALQENGVPSGNCNTRAEMLLDPQVQHNGTVIESEHAAVGRVLQPRPVARMSKTPQAIRSEGPVHGQHTDEVLTELGLSADELASLRDRAIIA